MNVVGLWLLNLLRPYLFRIILYGSIAAALGGGFLYLKYHYESIGYQRAIAEMIAQDKEAGDAARAGIKNVDDCDASHDIWDATRGVCEYP
jgi:hypothetical protein